jgi:hypothetical protein
MANNENGFYRSEPLYCQGNISSDLSSQAQLEDLGSPPMEWMPRKNVMAIVRKIDAELSQVKGV